MEFQFEFPNGFELYDLFLMNKLYARKKTSRRVGTALVRILLAVIGLLLILICGLGLLGHTFIFPVNGIFAVILLVYGILILALSICYHYFCAKRAKQIMLQTVGSVSLILNEKEVIEKTSVSESNVEYSSIKSVYYWKNTWFLFLDDRHAEILALRCMKNGDAKELPAFLEKKTRKPIQYINKKDKN